MWGEKGKGELIQMSDFFRFITADAAPAPPHRCKPWRWVGHLLGHEARGSLAHALKQAGLIQVTSACTSLSFPGLLVLSPPSWAVKSSFNRRTPIQPSLSSPYGRRPGFCDIDLGIYVLISMSDEAQHPPP